MRSAKLKTLAIHQLLEKYSDEEHPLSTTDLLALLEEMGIKAERKSIYSDIEALKTIGCDIVTVVSPKRGYFMGSRLFELAEVILLIDAVTSAGFITPKKSNSLIEKLKTLISKGQAESVISQVYVEASPAKCDNEEIYITIDNLYGAISSNRKVKFTYRRRNIDFNNKKKYTERTFIVSPYALIWKDDHYYLICNNGKYNNLMNLRIDRMKKLTVLDEKARDVREISGYENGFDAQDYSARMFNMFSGEACRATLKCHLSLQEVILDRFGSRVPLSASDADHFETTVDATLSDGFVSWLMQYGSKIIVVEPKQLADMVKDKAKSILDLYGG